MWTAGRVLGARDVGTPLRCPSSEASALVAQAKGLSLGPSAHTQVFGVYFALVEPIGVRRLTSKVSKRVRRKKKKKVIGFGKCLLRALGISADLLCLPRARSLGT